MEITMAETVLIVVFGIGLVIIWVEYKLGYPWGIYDGMVWMILPPFLKRIRIFGRWFGFSKDWKFLFFKRLDDA